MSGPATPTDPPAKGVHTVFIVSDATGVTAGMVVEAALAQFRGARVTLQSVSDVRTVEKLTEVVRSAAAARAMIVHTLAIPELRDAMLNEGKRYSVVTIDLLGPLITRLSESLEIAPLAKPGLLRQLDESYFQRIEAIDFAVRHDDGANTQDLPKVDLVLVGVSRTSKTPLSIFLANRRWRVANVPIVVDMDPPEALLRLDPRRVIALTIQPTRLVDVRKARQAKMPGRLPPAYSEMRQVRRELEWADLTIRRAHWPVVDVTNKSIEESAAEVLAVYRRRMGSDAQSSETGLKEG